MFVKICGMTSQSAVDAAVEAGADAIGFVFAASPREVSVAQARAWCRDVPARVLRVAVMRHPDRRLVERVVGELAPDWLQTDFEDLAAFELPTGCSPLPVYRSGEEAPRVPPPRLLFEGPVSGSGHTADWTAAGRLAARTELVLAGGLHTGNVAAAIDAVRPWGVDVSSGVESARGVKDASRIMTFVARARAAADQAADNVSQRALEE